MSDESPSSASSVQYPELDETLKGGLNIKAMKYFGAGAIMASVTIGSGETLSASRGGAIFAYGFMWALCLSAILKGVQVYTAARHFTLTGRHPMEDWKQIPGPRHWVPWFFAVLSIACMPFWLSGLPMMIGGIINWILGMPAGESGSPEAAAFLLQSRIWGTVMILVAVGLTWLQRYGVLEKVQTVIVALLLVSMLIACYASNPDWMAAITGLFKINMPEYADWVGDKYPKIYQKGVTAELIWYLGAIGGGTYDYLGYVGCMREKKWGLIGRKHDGDIDTSTENIARGKRWLIPAKVDVGVGFLAVLIFTICFTILGATILHPQQLVPEGRSLLTHQAEFLTQFHAGLGWLYKVGIFMAFFGTIYGAYEIYIRTAEECLYPVSKKVRDMGEKKFRSWVLMYCMIGGLALMWTVESPVDLVKPAAIIGGVFTCGLWCFAMVWTDKKFLPKGLQMRPILLSLTVISGTVLTAAGMYGIIGYGKSLMKDKEPAIVEKK